MRTPRTVCIPGAEFGQKQDVIYLREYCAARDRAKNSLYVLVAEDDPGNQKIIAEIFEQAGHHVKIVEDGEFALNELQQATYDILILDMHMPNMDGIDVINALHFVQSEHGEVPIMMLSMDATLREIDECKALGVDSFFSEPIEAARILDEVMRLVTKQMQTQVKQSAGSGSAPSEQEGKAMINLFTLADLETLSPDSHFVPDLVQSFVEDSEAAFEQMRSALNTSRIQDFKDLLHGMRGSAISIGAERLADMCCELTSADEAHLCTNLAQTLSRLAEMLASTYTRLSEYINSR